MITSHFDEKKEKNKETKPIFENLYLGNAGCDLVEIWNVRYCMMVEGISTAKIVWFRTSSTKLCIRENCIFVLPVNIYTHGCGMPASWVGNTLFTTFHDP